MKHLTTTTNATYREINFPALLVGLLCVQPLFVLVFKSWSSGILILAGFTCLVALVISKSQRIDVHETVSMDWSFRIFLLSFSLPFILISFSGFLSNKFNLSTLDSPARFLIAIPIFLLARQVKLDVVKILILGLTLGLILTLVDQEFFPSEHPWSPSRMSNQFADPLSFGYISLTFALVSLASLFHEKSQPFWLMILKGTACCVGFYLSVMTESRTGWFAIPLVLIFLLYVKRKNLTFRSQAFALIFIAIASVVAYSTIEKINSRMNAGVDEFTGYSFQGVAPDTSIGMRITFLRIAYDMVSKRPLTGYGNTQITKPDVPNIVRTYASPYTIAFALSSGFHNEIITNAVQYGLLVAAASLLLFMAPLGIYWQSLKKSSYQKQHAAVVGIVFTLTFFVSSFSTEVFGLKYTTSLYALITALLCAATTRNNSEAS